MEKVLIRIPGAGTLEVETAFDAKHTYILIKNFLMQDLLHPVREIKRGPRPKVKEPQNG